ncbi:hypothetical protein MWU49_16825 [Alcanivorax sp. S6407]|uniref:hypothetical protein n=1 Tax=Alcanivorax sp. S6407 TaxID=2926424 RepID=UPI001FF655DD|nr:hypothetical protein [Alcanivorax sp. S6407]MCK0155381.1 hypothetical protein [Alcanivorax sp. S6407]
MDEYRAPQSTQLLDSRIEPASAVRIGALAAAQVAGFYSAIVFLLMITVGKADLYSLVFWVVFTLASTLIAVLVTLSFGLLVNRLLRLAGQPTPLWFCTAVLLMAGLFMSLGEWGGSSLIVVGWGTGLYGVPVAWLASTRLLNHERLYRESISRQ